MIKTRDTLIGVGIGAAVVTATILWAFNRPQGPQHVIRWTNLAGQECVTVKGQKGRNGAGDGGDATTCGDGSIAIGGSGGGIPMIADAGEWVTDPRNGSRVCRLRAPIVRGMTFSRSFCGDWQVPQPGWGEQVTWLHYRQPTGTQIHMEGGWRP